MYILMSINSKKIKFLRYQFDYDSGLKRVVLITESNTEAKAACE